MNGPKAESHDVRLTHVGAVEVCTAANFTKSSISVHCNFLPYLHA